jgi:hypothetical protein
MPNRTAKFASVITAALLVSGCLTLASGATTEAADNCLAAPNGTTPDGGHWYYRIDRPTKRHCWYIKGETEKRSLAAPQDLSPSANAVSPSRRTATPPALANARDELPLPQPRFAQDSRAVAAQPVPEPAAAPASTDQTGSIPDAIAQRTAPASPWPDPSVTSPSAATASAGPAPVANSAAATPPSNPVAAPPPPSGIAAAADSPPAKQSISIPKVLLVIAGALSVISVMGGFGFGGKQPAGRRDTRVKWPANPHSVAAGRRPPPTSPNAGQRTRDARAADDPSRRIAEMMARLMRDAPG